MSSSDELKIIRTARDEQLVVHYMMLTRQMTKLSDCITHIMRLSTQEDQKHKGIDYNGYRAYAMTELADVFCQTKKLCEILEVDPMQTYVLGIERDKEKKREYLESHPKDEWI